MTPVRFVHAADLHLDSPFRGLDAQGAPEHVTASLREATFRAFDAVIDLCLARQVDFLVVAGDVYDAEDRSTRAQLAFRDGVQRLARAGVPSFVIHGNHDPMLTGPATLAQAAGVTTFGTEVGEAFITTRAGERVRLVGASYATRAERRNLAATYRRANPEGLFTVALLHANVGGREGHEPYAPCDAADLQGADVDYWALGHIHTRATVLETPRAEYPGNTQGRSVRETGPRGVLLVEGRGRRDVGTEFVATDVVRWDVREVDLSPAADIGEASDLLLAAMDAARSAAGGRHVVVRLIATGRTALDGALRRPEAHRALVSRLREEGAALEPFAWTEELRIATLPDADIDQRAQGEDLLALALRAGARAVSDAEAMSEARRALEPASSYADIVIPTGAEWEALVREARLLCRDAMEGEP